MKIILFGGSGMVGQGVLRECSSDPRVEKILVVARSAGTPGIDSTKTTELVHTDFYTWNSVETAFDGYDACFFCLGTSAVGMKEADYRRITYDLTLSVAETLLRHHVRTFIYVSGQGTDAHGRAMWARVKGATENALFNLSFETVFCFRPGFIQPMHGIRSKTGWYQAIYSVTSWMYPLLRRIASSFVTNSEEVGRAMIDVTAGGYQRRILENADIHIAAQQR